MTNEQWELLVSAVHGKTPTKPITGFIVDSPWIPGWAGVSTLQFYSSEEIWFQTNKKVVETFQKKLMGMIESIQFKSP